MKVNLSDEDKLKLILNNPKFLDIDKEYRKILKQLLIEYAGVQTDHLIDENMYYKPDAVFDLNNTLEWNQARYIEFLEKNNISKEEYILLSNMRMIIKYMNINFEKKVIVTNDSDNFPYNMINAFRFLICAIGIKYNEYDVAYKLKDKYQDRLNTWIKPFEDLEIEIKLFKNGKILFRDESSELIESLNLYQKFNYPNQIRIPRTSNNSENQYHYISRF